MENLVWALIIVSGTANVSFSSGYPSKELCEDAVSIAKTGMTVAEKKAADDAQQARRTKAAQEYQEAHPPREPTAEDRKQCFDNRAGLVLGWGSTSDSCSIEKDGLTHFQAAEGYFGTSTYNQAAEIKYAKCVMVNSKEK